MFVLAKRYEIIQQLGDGGNFGVTFLARDILQPSKPLCVVKQLRPNHTDPRVIKFFEEEAITLEKLGKHPHIPQLLAHFEENQNFYIVQEYIQGHDLSEEIFLGKQLSEDYVTKLLQEVLEILYFVHQNGVIHRDIKPRNLMRRRRDGKIFLIDFGAVKELGTLTVNSQGKVTSTVAIGTPGYIPSEQGMGQPCFASDIYALGITAIQALTGILPSQLQKESHTGEIIWRQHTRVSNHLGKILTKMVRHNHNQRYKSVSQVLADLNSIGKYPRRRAIVGFGLAFAGFAAVTAFIPISGIIPPAFKPTPTATSPSPSREVKELRFADIPTSEFPTKEQQQSWKTFIEKMEQRLGIPVKIVQFNSYKEVIEAINSGKLQIASFGGKSYIKAASQGKIRVFAQTINDDNSRGYYSYLIANKNNAQLGTLDKNTSDRDVINAIKNGSKLKFAFGDRNSTSGFLVPNFCFFAKNGVDPQKVFQNPLHFLSKHQRTALDVADGRIDVATNNSEGLARLKRTNPKAHAKIKVIWKSRIIPSGPIAYRKDLPENLKDDIRDFFYNYEDQQVLNALGWSGFEPGDDSTWEVIRDLDDIEKKMEEVKSNNGLTANERQQELTKLQARLQEICIN